MVKSMRLSGRGLQCVRGGRQIFADLNLEVSSGQTLAVTGPNGAGKSSLLRIIAGLLPLASGSIVVEHGHQDLTLAEQAHYLGHRDAFKPTLTTTENSDFLARFFEWLPRRRTRKPRCHGPWTRSPSARRIPVGWAAAQTFNCTAHCGGTANLAAG